MGMMRGILLLVLAALAVVPAGAWEARVSDVDRRLREVQSLSGLRDILRNARQQRKPGWARRIKRADQPVYWTESAGGKTYHFGVGMVRGVKDPGLRLSAAQDRARASLAHALGSVAASSGTVSAEAELSGSIPIDWYSDRTGALYALVVVVR